MSQNFKVGLIGAGNIAKEHLSVINDIDKISVTGITSRTLSKAGELANQFKIDNVYLDYRELINSSSPDALIVTVSPDQTFSLLKRLIPYQIPLFIEKPPGLFPNQTNDLVDLANKYNVNNMVGYNRRFYSIFHKGIKLINENGRLLGIAVEGHERFWKIFDKVPKVVRENWIYANSTHTLDLLRFFAGNIKLINSLSKSLNEKNGDQFVGSVEFDTGTIGSYSSHWYSPGGWSVKLYGVNTTVEYCPLEEGIWIDSKFKIHKILPDKIDINYKPGFYNQMLTFIEMIETGVLNWPGVDLQDSLKTMELAKGFFVE
tara:strand:+ start:32728 stop:33675 length:948 start_codon:yes stop_codon:yes gene_type:complete